MTEIKKRGRGRPRSEPTEGKRYSIFTNVSADTRARLEKSADRNGQSLAKEADDRLRQSLWDDEYMGGTPTAEMLRTLGGVIIMIERAYGKKWNEDSIVAIAVEAAVAKSIGTIVRAISLDDIGKWAFMDLLDREGLEPKLDAETLKKVEQRSEAYNEAVQFGLSVAMGATQKRVSA